MIPGLDSWGPVSVLRPYLVAWLGIGL